MDRWNVGILVFDGVEVLDFAGPFEVFSRVRLTPGIESGRSDDSAPFHVFTVARSELRRRPCRDARSVTASSAGAARSVARAGSRASTRATSCSMRTEKTGRFQRLMLAIGEAAFEAGFLAILALLWAGLKWILRRVPGVDSELASTIAGAAAAMLGFVGMVRLLRRRANERHAHSYPFPDRQPKPPDAPLAVAPAQDAARSVRSVALFSGAVLLCFGPLGAVAASWASPLAGLAVAGCVLAGATGLYRVVRSPVPEIRLTADRLLVGERSISLLQGFSCSFPDRTALTSVWAELTGAPAVVIRSATGTLRFQPGRYDPALMARLVEYVACRATGGDAREWLLARWSGVRAAEGISSPGPWIHPVVGIGIGIHLHDRRHHGGHGSGTAGPKALIALREDRQLGERRAAWRARLVTSRGPLCAASPCSLPSRSPSRLPPARSIGPFRVAGRCRPISTRTAVTNAPSWR